ncbi:MAG: tetratricopeptide repeat protein, partial [Pirellulales bacterium]|nr:tetratricopeptide repeat protein [Pirellulales bacterium]
MIRSWRTSLWTGCICAVAVLVATPVSVAQESSDAAIEQYGSAVDFQNLAVSDPDTAEVNYALAVDEWKTFLDKFPKDPLASKAQFYLGVCQLQLGQYKDAVASFEATVANYPKFDMLATANYNLGIARMEQGRKANDKAALGKALEAFTTVVTDYPKSSNAPESQFQIGELQYELGKKKEATKSYQAALELFGEKSKRRPTVLYNLGFVQEETGDAAGAEKTYDIFLTEYGQKKPPPALLNEVYLRKGEVLIKRKKYKDADPWLAAAARAKGFKKADLATVQQAFCKFNLKQYADAAKLYAGVVEGWPKSQYSNTSKLDAGTAYYWAGDYDAAAEWLKKAIAAGGDLANQGTRWLARTYLKQKKPAEALTAIDAVLPKAAGSKQLPELLMARADALYEIPKRRGESIAAYAKVADEHPGSSVAPRAMYLAAFVAQEKEKYKDGLKSATAFLDKFANKPNGKQYVDDVKYIAAGCHLLLKQYKPAQELYTQLLTEYPNDKNADRWKVQIGLCQFLEKKYGDAAKHFAPIAAGLKDAKLKAEANHLLGASQFELGQYQPARESLQTAITADPKWRDADKTLLLLSHAQQRTGDTKAALASAKRVLAEFPKSSVLDEAHYRLGDYAYEQKDYKTAAKEYQTVVDKYPKSQFAPYAYYGLGWTQVKENQFDKA